MSIFESFVRMARLAAPILVLPVIATAQAVNRSDASELEEEIKHAASVGFEWVDQPLNSILLIRNERATCAIRFLSYRRANDARPPTSFDTGDASLFAVYEFAEFTHGPKHPIGPVTRKELDYRGLRGLGRLAFDVGNDTIRCGRHKYSWMFPTGLLIKKEQSDTFVAPTNWTSFDEVRPDHPGLRWYQSDPQTKRAVIVIPKEELIPSSSQ